MQDTVARDCWPRVRCIDSVGRAFGFEGVCAMFPRGTKSSVKETVTVRVELELTSFSDVTCW